MTQDATPPAPGERATSSGDRSTGPKALLARLLTLEIVRFGLIGLVNTAFGFGLFVVLQLTLGRVTHYLAVLVLSTCVAIVQAYSLQRWLVFRSNGPWWQGLLRFGTVYFGALLLNLAALPVLVEVLHLQVIPAQGILTVVQVLGTYAAHRLFTFRQPSKDSTAAGRNAGEGTTATAPASSNSPGDA
jgi:putative flippase GtrA